MFEVRTLAALGTLLVVGVAMAGVAGAAGPAADAHPQTAPENDTQPPGDTPTPPPTPTPPEETPTRPDDAPTPPEPTGLEESARAAESLGLDVHMEMDEDGVVMDVEEEVDGTVVLKIDGPSEDYEGTGTYEVDGQRRVELARPNNAGDLTISLSGEGFTFSRTMIFEYRDIGCGVSSSSSGLPDLDQLAASRSLLVVGFESQYVVERNNETRRGNNSFALPAPEVEDCDEFLATARSAFDGPDEELEAKAWNETVEERNGSIVSEDAVSMAELREQEDVPEDITPPADLTPPEDFEDGPPADLTPPENLTPPEDITPPGNLTPPEDITPPEGEFESTPPESGFQGTPPEDDFEQTPPEDEFEGNFTEPADS